MVAPLKDSSDIIAPAVNRARWSSRTAALGAAGGTFLLLVLSLALNAGCASQPAKPQASTTAPPAAKCRGTIGLEVIPMSKSTRQTLGLDKDSKGAVVSSVMPGGPSAAAGIQVGDVVEAIGDTRVTNDCEYAKWAYGRVCEPVKIRLRRGGDIVELNLVPVDQKAFLDKVCAGGNLDACFRSAWLDWDRHHPDARSLDAFTTACTKGSGEACAYEGLILSDDPQREKDSLAPLQRACELDSAGGCATLAFLYATAKTVAKDDRKAAELYRKSCDLGDAQGCYNAALMADEGRGVQRDAVRAASDYEEACQLGSSTACTNLGYVYENGKGVRQDKFLALANYERGCDGSACQPSNLGGCLNVGRAYRDGIGTAKDEAKAAEIFREACDRKENKDDIHSAENGARACSLLGGLYLAGDGVAKDLAQGRELSQLGCQRGDSFGCFNAAVVYAGGQGVDKDPAKAADYYDQACKAGDGEACHELAAAYAKGHGVAKDTKLSKSLDQKACELGFEAACPKKGKKKS